MSKGKFLNAFIADYNEMLCNLMNKHDVEIQQDDTFYSSCGNLYEQKLTIRNNAVKPEDIQDQNR